MEKIFDIAKDSEKSWGVIAQGIDENFEELDKQINGNTPEYVERQVLVEEGKYIAYTGGNIKTQTETITAGIAKVSLTKGQSIKIVANGNNAWLAIALQGSDGVTYTEIKRYEVDKALETHEYTAENDCVVCLTFRIGGIYTHSVYVKDASVDFGLVGELKNKVDEAPIDGKQYVRKNKTWEEIKISDYTVVLSSVNIVQQDNWVNGSMLLDGTIRDDRTYGFRSKEPIKVEGGASVVLMTNASLPNGTKIYEYTDSSYSKSSLVKSGTQLSVESAFVLQQNTKYIVLMLSIEGTITTDNYLDYAKMVGLSYSQHPMKFQPYSKSVIGKEYEIEGVHRHAPTLKWIAMGDSITDGSYSTSSGGIVADKRETCWAKRVADINGYELTNVGIGGIGWLNKGAQGDRKNAKEQIVDYDFANYDIVTLAFGINDWKSTTKEEYGTIEDAKTDETIAGAMKYCIEKILADNPYIRIIVITPMNCHSGEYANNYAIGKQVHGKTLADLFELMTSVCKYDSLPYIDMTYKGIINRCNVLQICGDGLPADDPNRDNVHPTLEGHKRMSYIISQEMKYNS